MKKDLHELPKLRDSISFIYIEHAVIEQNDSSIILIQSLPHMRGDEPVGKTISNSCFTVCPTCVGMNRITPCLRRDRRWSAPHAWG